MVDILYKPWHLLIPIALFLSAQLHAQDSAAMARYKPQLQLIDSIKSYIANDLGMNVGTTFYNGWSLMPGQDSMYTYLYVSRIDRVERDSAFTVPLLYDTESAATAKSREMTARGFQTLVYKTAGNSFALLSPKLLSYPPEAIA